MGIVITDSTYILSSKLKEKLIVGSPIYADIYNKMNEINSEVVDTIIMTDCGIAYHVNRLLGATEGLNGMQSVVYQSVYEICKSCGFDYRTASYLTDIHYVDVNAVKSILHNVMEPSKAEAYYDKIAGILPARMLDGECHTSAVGVYNIVKGGSEALIRTENIDMMNELHTELWNASIDTRNAESSDKTETDVESSGVAVTCHFDGDCHVYTAEGGTEFEANDFINAKLYADVELKELVTHDITDDKVSIKLTTPFGGIEEYISWADLNVPLYAVWPVDPRKELMGQVENIMWDAITDEGLKRILIIYNEERQDLNGKDNDAVFSEKLLITKNRPYKY